MRIDAYNKINQLYQSTSVKKTQKSSKATASDKFEISQTAKDYQVARSAVDNATDVRIQKIQDIKSRMEAGTYNINIENVADKILDDYYNNL